jgi:DNA-binding transcriptional MerR regulator
MAYDTPIYNLKAVVKETGVRPDTLRAWERRYGLPMPERTDGGHRIFSQRDVDTIKWLVARQEEGLRIKGAVDLWHELAAEGRLPLPDALATPPTSHRIGETLVDLRQAWVAAALGFDEQRASQVLEQAFALYAPETVSIEVLQKGIAQIGDDWQRGQVSVQQEHFASELAMRRLQALIMSAPPPTRAGQLVVAAPPEEDHALSLLLLTFLLRRRGWKTVYLGANVPIERMEATTAVTVPQMVILGAQRLPTAATLLDMANFLRERNVPVAFGGRVFNLIPDLPAVIPGYFLGRRLEQAPEAIEGLLVAVRPVPNPPPPPAGYKAALAHYRERELLVRADVRRAMEGTDVDYDHMVYMSADIAQNIAAALALGNIDFLDGYLDWMETMHDASSLSGRMLEHYLAAYHKAVLDNLGEHGWLVAQWLARRMKK